jgi:hypothetical protein
LGESVNAVQRCAQRGRPQAPLDRGGIHTSIAATLDPEQRVGVAFTRFGLERLDADRYSEGPGASGDGRNQFVTRPDVHNLSVST